MDPRLHVEALLGESVRRDQDLFRVNHKSPLDPNLPQRGFYGAQGAERPPQSEDVKVFYDDEDTEIVGSLFDMEPPRSSFAGYVKPGQVVGLGHPYPSHFLGPEENPKPRKPRRQDGEGAARKPRRGTIEGDYRAVMGHYKYKCDQCPKIFRKPISLTIHQRTHTGEKPYQCPTCQKLFSLVCNLKTHMKLHAGERPFSCDFCGRTFAQKLHAKKHMETHTSGKQKAPKKMAADSDNGESSKKSSKKTERQLKEKIYQCSSCGKGFSTMYSMFSHMKKHTGGTPFHCDICGQAFPKKREFNHHRKAHLNGSVSEAIPEGTETGGIKVEGEKKVREKVHQCSSCGKGFASIYYMYSHMKIHTGGTPFNCDFCGKAFAQKRELNNHRKIHIDGAAHGETVVDLFSGISSDLEGPDGVRYECSKIGRRKRRGQIETGSSSGEETF